MAIELSTVLSAVAAKIAVCCVEPILGPIGQWLCYSFVYDSNIESMENQLRSLQITRDSVQISVDSARRNGEEIEVGVATWLKKVDKTIEEATQVLKVKDMGHTWCSIGACLKLVPRHQQSSKAKKIMEDIDVLAEERGKFGNFSHLPEETATPRHRDYVDSESRMSTVKRLKEALGDDKIHVIGVWGMPGVGKTTLVTEVKRQAKKEKLFDEVALANVTHSPDPKRIQGEIGDALGMKFDKESVPGRAGRLWKRLTNTEDNKKILIILDDIWPNLDLKEIGIPYEGCKLLLTSRNREVLIGEMGTQKDFGLEVLGEEEAWSLFKKMAGDCVKDPNLGSIATDVANACAGLPLALVTVSKALKNKSLEEWKNALRKLRRPSPKHLIKMQSTIFNSIELSYNHLESEEAKAVFLLCAQEGYYISEMDLLKYCYGLGLFYGNNTMEDVRESLYTNVRILKDCCLLLHSPYSSKILHMHDVVRDAAKLIASRDQNMFVVGDDGGQIEWPETDALKTYVRFFVRGGDIHEVLPNEMQCPELRLLYVYGGDRPLKISNTFFEGMGKLRVLDLTKMRLLSLPESLQLLRSLQTLCLDQCVLGDIALIGKLKNLAVLSLHSSHISQLPREIGLLTRLQLLDLSHCSKLELIQSNVLSSLVALEELYMGNSFVQWEALNNASLAELKHLSHLITLEIHIPNASNLPKDLSFEKFERYVILVGDVWDWPDRRGEASRTLKLKLNTSFQSEVGIKMLLKRTENLYLDELKGVKSVLNELDRDGFKQLKHLHIQNNTEIKFIINLKTLDTAFPALETILLKNMISLEEIICHDQLQKAFGNLRVLKVEQCDKLKFVFPASIARGLSQLEELEIRKCSIMGAIVMKEEGKIEDTDLALFPQLRCLALEHLPKLMSLLSTQNSLVTYAGKIMSEGKPDFHMPILHEQDAFHNLERLVLSSIGLEDIQHNQHRATWSSCRLENMQSTSRFQNLSHLEVQGSGNIKYLLSFSTARYMVQLKRLHIVECKVMEEILVIEDLGEEEEIPFPRLEIMFLKELPILKRFCEASNIKFPSLKQLVIDNCPKLKTFISKSVSLGMTTSCKELKEMNAEESRRTVVQPLFSEGVAFPSLEYLIISHMKDLKIIWRNQFAVDSFYKLQCLVVKFCENLVNIFQSDMLARFQSLETLLVEDCGSLEEVFELEGLNVTETHAITIFQLKELKLVNLPIMRHVWSKDPKPIFSFQNLQRVRVVDCWSLKSLFPASVATCLAQLELLVIVASKVLEEIVAGEEAEQPIASYRFVFPQVTVLHLALLPRLKWFYRGVHTSEWPMLKDMFVAGCLEVEIFASELSSFQDILQLEIPIKQPLFLVDEAPFPSLEKLKIAYMPYLKIIWHSQFSADSFCKPQTINVEFCENLIDQETCAVTSTQLKELHLIHLQKLKHIWNKDPQQIVSFPGAEEDFPKIEISRLNHAVREIILMLKNLSESYPSGANT